MFTGIVEELGRVEGLEWGADRESAVLRLRGPVVTGDVRHGASIAVNGVCLTVTHWHDETFAVDVMGETLHRTSLGDLDVGDRVNLERAMAADGRFGGHVVQGHVDGTGTIRSRAPAERWEVVRITMPADLSRYVVEKGSITVDGISLTVSATGDDWFEVALIPTTLTATTLGKAPVGARVNLEVDVLAKYVERLLPAVATTPGAPADGGAA